MHLILILLKISIPKSFRTPNLNGMSVFMPISTAPRGAAALLVGPHWRRKSCRNCKKILSYEGGGGAAWGQVRRLQHSSSYSLQTCSDVQDFN